MYTIKCDGQPLLDIRDSELMVINPKVKLKTNAVGEASFSIYKNHPKYGELKKLKSVFEIADEIGVIFRGRMTEDTRDFHNGKAVDLEGAMAFFNDTVVPPYDFPNDWLDDVDYIAAAESGNVVAFFLDWLIDNHNSQVQDFQKFKLGNITVSDPNNYITRSETGTPKTWEALKSKLFDSALGGYLCIRYEADGNYIDYLSEFELVNTQEIDFGVNMLDIKHNSDASATYTAIIPIGAEIEVEGETETKAKLNLSSITDGAITEDIYKVTLSNGLHALYSQSGVEEYGWICAPVADTTWQDVATVQNLLTKAEEWFLYQGAMLSDTVEIKAADLHFSDAEIRSFRIYRKIKVNSIPHIIDSTYDLTELDVELLKPQNTKITIGKTKLTLTDLNSKEQSDNIQRIERVENELKQNVSNVQSLENRVDDIAEDHFFYIKYSAYADGHIMTDSPDENTVYIGTCNTSETTAPSDYRAYQWARLRGQDGANGKGINNITNYYLATAISSGITLENPGWSKSVMPITSTLRYLWNYEKITYNDGSTPTKTQPAIIGVYGTSGADGVGIASIIEYYAVSNSNAVAPENWSTTPQTMTEILRYLWNYERVNYTNNTFADTDPVVIGVYGDKGTPGKAGDDGQTSYLHIKYSDDGETFTANNGETLGAYIGTLVDFNELDSKTFSDYTWKKFTEDVDEELADIRQTIIESVTSVTNTSEEIIFEALKAYTQTGDFETYREIVNSQLSLLAEQLNLKFTETVSQINGINGDLQAQLNTITKYFTFNINGLTIGQSESPFKVVIDNDLYQMLVNGIDALTLDPDGLSTIPELRVTKSCILFDNFITDENDIISCEFIGGEG